MSNAYAILAASELEAIRNRRGQSCHLSYRGQDGRYAPPLNHSFIGVASKLRGQEIWTKQVTVDLDRLLKLRLVVGRFGEMDVAQWWNTRGQLGPIGAAALRRGFPRTYRFAQARSVFAVATQRCTHIFDQPGSATLWRLPVDIEEAFDARWEHWLDHATAWEPVFDRVAGVGGTDLAAAVQTVAGVAARDVEVANGLGATDAGRAVPIPGLFSASDDNVSQLALGFVHASVGALAVPYQHLGDV